MSNVMEDVDYNSTQFNRDVREERHPLYLAERHYCFDLTRNEWDELEQVTDKNGKPTCSPRLLRHLVVYRMVSATHEGVLPLRACDPLRIPSNCYPLLLREALYQREGAAVEWIVCRWPWNVLRLYDLIPPGDDLFDDYLTKPTDELIEMALIDYLLLGLLKLTPLSNLKVLDLTGFHKDRKLCKEICRVPVLWLKPSERRVEDLYEHMSQVIELSKDKAERFLNRISVVYSNMDSEYLHGNIIDPVTIQMDLHIDIDDVPIGLSLQSLSPFNFRCRKIWIKPIYEVRLPLKNLSAVLDLQYITHIELENPLLPTDNRLFQSVLDTLTKLPCLTALSLPNSIDIKANQQMASILNKTLRRLPRLERLDLSYCTLTCRLSTILSGLNTHAWQYLCLKDCRLNSDDISFLLQWRPLPALYELNLSSNNLLPQMTDLQGILKRMPKLTCLSLAHCQLTPFCLKQVLAVCRRHCPGIRMLHIPGYTPLAQADLLEVIGLAIRLPVLQRLVIFPQLYAFPGSNETEREAHRLLFYKLAYRYLALKECSHIELI